KQQRWRDFLAVMPREPNSVVLKCYYFRAQLAAGEREVAWAGAKSLWVHGESRPKECDPLFTAWQAAGGLTDEIVWARMLQAFDARQRSILRFAASKASRALKPAADTLQTVYASPDSLARLQLKPSDPYAADILSHGLVHLSQYSAEKALTYWQDYSDRFRFSEEQTRAVEYAIAQRLLFARSDAHRQWLHAVLARLEDDSLVGIRLRWALAEQDWAGYERTLPLLSEAAQSDTVWRYWLAEAQAQAGNEASARSLLQALAQERDYYGFLAADKLGLAYAFNNQPLQRADNTPLRGLPALRRIEELQFHEEVMLAQSEWYKVLQDTPDASTHQQLALLASDQGWYRMAIDAATRAEAWDALDIRFPTPYRTVFEANAAAQKVPGTELMAIARRESAFFPQARSPVGALGLMQIMPATGAQVASGLGARHSNADLLNVEHNVLLGSVYYRQLLDRFNGNRVFALTAYNAGPHRVDRWRNKPDQAVPVELWIETIPYRETRNYVQAVLSYNVVFRHLMGETATLLTPAERQASY
ncbi:MAG: transglycosylase SLT domain-containing protein, partial [Halioglobus sp.]|nr:transglycosylase SLT domain-containing protein [Halioglobus sp.]